MPVYILAGEEDFELSRRLKSLKESLLVPEWTSINYLRLDNPSIIEICDIAASLPFGPGNKVIVIDHCDLFTKKKTKANSKSDTNKLTDSALKRQLDQLDKALGNVSPNTYVIFSCPYNFDSTLRLSKIVECYATIEKFEKERYFSGGRNPKLETWCRKEAKLFGTTIDDTALAYLIDSCEANLRQISSELQKISVQIAPNHHITKTIVEESSAYRSHIFTLVDRWISGDAKQTLTSLKELLSRQSAIPLIAAMHTILAKWIEMKIICLSLRSTGSAPVKTKQRWLPPDLVKQVANKLKAIPVLVEKDLKRINNVSLETLIEKQIQLTRYEDMVKSGQLPEQHAMCLFVSTVIDFN